jgi:hypothetical protein
MQRWTKCDKRRQRPTCPSCCVAMIEDSGLLALQRIRYEAASKPSIKSPFQGAGTGVWNHIRSLAGDQYEHQRPCQHARKPSQAIGC